MDLDLYCVGYAHIDCDSEDLEVNNKEKKEKLIEGFTKFSPDNLELLYRNTKKRTDTPANDVLDTVVEAIRRQRRAQ